MPEPVTDCTICDAPDGTPITRVETDALIMSVAMCPRCQRKAVVKAACEYVEGLTKRGPTTEERLTAVEDDVAKILGA